jgi:hypothetical protein
MSGLNIHGQVAVRQAGLSFQVWCFDVLGNFVIEVLWVT